MPPEAAARYRFSDLKVIVLDDNPHMLRLLVSILRALGFENVRTFQEGEAAFAALKDEGADLILLDWHMKPIDGLEFTRMVRCATDSPNPFVPIVMITGHTELRRVIEARDAGANEVMAKPVSSRALYARIISLIEHPRPFIRNDTFFGPDRRRRNLGPPPDTPERRSEETALPPSEPDRPAAAEA